MEFRADRCHAVHPTYGPDQNQYRDIDMPTQSNNRRWRIVVRLGEDFSAKLFSRRRPGTEPTVFSVTSLPPDWKRASQLGRACTAALEGEHGAMQAQLAPTRVSFGGFMGGMGQHEWVGGKHDPGRRNVQYASGLSEPEAAAYHTRMQRNIMPELTKGKACIAPLPRALGAQREMCVAPHSPSFFARPSSPLLPAWALTYAIVYCFWAFSVALCNAMHYDTGDKGPSRAVWWWSGDGVGVRCGAWFLLPNHGIAVELGQCTIRWRGDLLMHGSHETEGGRACTNELLSVWNGVGGALLRSRLDEVAFQSKARGREFWAQLPAGTPVVVRNRACALGTAQAKKRGLKSAKWRWSYGVTSTAPAPTCQSKKVVMQRSSGERSIGNDYVKVVTKKSGGKKKTSPVWSGDVRVRWIVLTTSQIDELGEALGVEAVAEQIRECTAREVECVARSRSGETKAQAKRKRRRKTTPGTGQSAKR